MSENSIRKSKVVQGLGKIDANLKMLVLALLAIILFGGIIKPSSFLNVDNFQSIGQQLSEYGLMALGVGVCMISGGIDLSTVYIANLSGISIALYMRQFNVAEGSAAEMGIMLSAVLIAILIGALCGIFNGILVSWLRIPAMLATLGTQQLFMGIAIVVSKGSTVSGVPRGFTTIGTQMMFGAIPYSFLIFLLAAIILAFVMKRTKLGTRIYLVGTNEKSSKFSGINVRATLIKTYAISGILSAIAGIISLSRLNSAKADFGSSYVMLSILIVVLGGVNPNGGFGNISGIAIGVIVLQTLSSMLNMFPNVSNYYRDLIWGVTLILILIINYIMGRRNYKKAISLSKKKQKNSSE